MTEKDVRKWNKGFKISALGFVVVAIMSLLAIINVLITKETSVITTVLNNIENIILSLFLAFICAKTTVTPINKE